MTKRVTTILFGAAATVLLGATASAGQAQTASAAAASYDWTGAEVGAHVGANWSNSTSTTINTVTNAQEGTTGTSSASRVNGGFQGGYDRMMPSRLVVGMLAGAAFWGLADNSTSTIGANVHTNETKTNWTGSIVGRAGYGVGRALITGAAGLGWSTGSAIRTQVSGTTGNAVPGTVETLSTNQSGFTGGAGLAYGVTRHVEIVMEYRYSPRSKTNTFPIAQRSTSSTTHTDSLQVGASYRF